MAEFPARTIPMFSSVEQLDQGVEQLGEKKGDLFQVLKALSLDPADSESVTKFINAQRHTLDRRRATESPAITLPR